MFKHFIFIILIFILLFMYKFKYNFLMILISMEFFVISVMLLIFNFKFLDQNEWLFLFYIIFSVCESVIGIAVMINLIYYYGNQNVSMLNLKF